MTNSEKPEPWAKPIIRGIEIAGWPIIPRPGGSVLLTIEAERINAALEAHPELKRLRAVEKAAVEYICCLFEMRKGGDIPEEQRALSKAEGELRELLQHELKKTSGILGESAKAQGREGGE